MEPTQLGPYRLIRRIGRGGMAEVYLAVAYGASGFENRLAVKTLLPSLRGIGELERLLIEEAKIGARLCHRNLVRTWDLGIDEGVYYAAIELVDGADLASLLRKERLPAELAWLVAEELALALEYIHDARDESGRPVGLIHRDVSPSNVLLSRSGEVKLGDFGIAKATLLAEDTRPNVRKGKYAYMSPEQVASQPLSVSSDQFALGITLVELLTGKRPFDGDSVPATLENIQRAARPELAELSPDERALLWRCLEPKPANRFPSASELRSAITNARRAHPAVSAAALGAWVRRVVASS